MKYTRKLIRTLIEKDRICNKGLPITDTDKKNVAKELKYYENVEVLCVCLSIGLVIGLFICLQIFL